MINRIVVALVWVPILLIVLFLLPPYIFLVVAILICTISAYELLNSIGLFEHKRIIIYAVFSAAIIPAGVYFGISELVFLAVFLIIMLIVFFEAIFIYGKREQITFAQILIALFGGALIPLMISALVSMRNMPEGHLIVLLPVISAFITDGGSYFTGVLFGKHKAFPHVSPKKTIEGCVGGLVIGTVAMFIYGVVLVFTSQHQINFLALVLYGFVGSVFTQSGDLAFSLIKREYNIKDYGRFLAGHGGVLDRFDSMVFTAPAIYLLVAVLPAITVGG